MTDPKEALSEIDRLMRESRDRERTGWPIPLWWAVLTLIAMGASWWVGHERLPGYNHALVWAAHNLLGWGFTFYWKAKERAASGRDSWKGVGVMRIWAMFTLATWVVMMQVNDESVSMFCLLAGMAFLASGIVLETAAPQVIGVALALFTAFNVFFPTKLGVIAGVIALPVGMLVWAVSSWKARA